MSNDNQTILTKDGAEKLKEELNRLINVERPQIIEALASARAQGDLKENADYDAARNRQGEVEGRIKEIENILANAKIVREATNNDKVVGIGSKVTIKASNERSEDTYTIVGTVEADPMNNKISNVEEKLNTVDEKSKVSIFDSWFPTMKVFGVSFHFISCKAVISSSFRIGVSKKSPKHITISAPTCFDKSSA